VVVSRGVLRWFAGNLYSFIFISSYYFYFTSSQQTFDIDGFLREGYALFCILYQELDECLLEQLLEHN
jgi:hypothetical protein